MCCFSYRGDDFFQLTLWIARILGKRIQAPNPGHNLIPITTGTWPVAIIGSNGGCPCRVREVIEFNEKPTNGRPNPKTIVLVQVQSRRAHEVASRITMLKEFLESIHKGGVIDIVIV